jgi:hypothetical protein
MKRNYLLAILLFSGLWGLSEALLGGLLYRASVPYSSAPLTIVGLVILTFAAVYLPNKPTATLIAALAMLYKFLNAPFFGCHLLGILLTGISFDLFFNLLKFKRKTIAAIGTVYLSYASFAFMITCIFRYPYWTQAPLVKIVNHIGISGSLAALGCALCVPAAFNLAERLKNMTFGLKLPLALSSLSLLTTGLWIFGIVVFFGSI